MSCYIMHRGTYLPTLYSQLRTFSETFIFRKAATETTVTYVYRVITCNCIAFCTACLLLFIFITLALFVLNCKLHCIKNLIVIYVAAKILQYIQQCFSSLDISKFAIGYPVLSMEKAVIDNSLPILFLKLRVYNSIKHVTGFWKTFA